MNRVKEMVKLAKEMLKEYPLLTRIEIARRIGKSKGISYRTVQKHLTDGGFKITEQGNYKTSGNFREDTHLFIELRELEILLSRAHKKLRKILQYKHRYYEIKG